MTTIRKALGSDADALCDVCLRTADAGDDGAHLFTKPKLPGMIFAVPYAVHAPSLAFVAEDDEGVGGYIVGALDTVEFGEILEREWWPKLRAEYPLDRSGTVDDQRMTEHVHTPMPAPEVAYPHYPSHLHINLLPRMQGQGLGKKLMDTLTGALQAQGSPGVHLGVRARNKRAHAFYEYLGFTELTMTEWGATMGMRL